MASKLSTLCCGRNDELLFQRARRIVVAEFQSVIFGSYLPLLLGEKEWRQHKLEFENQEDYKQARRGIFVSLFKGLYVAALLGCIPNDTKWICHCHFEVRNRPGARRCGDEELHGEGEEVQAGRNDDPG